MGQENKIALPRRIHFGQRLLRICLGRVLLRACARKNSGGVSHQQAHTKIMLVSESKNKRNLNSKGWEEDEGSTVLPLRLLHESARDG